MIKDFKFRHSEEIVLVEVLEKIINEGGWGGDLAPVLSHLTFVSEKVAKHALTLMW